MTALLVGLALIGERAEVHIGHHQKTTLGNVPLYAAALLLPPLLAISVAVLSLSLSILISRNRAGLLWFDIITRISRWIIVMAAASASVQWARDQQLANCLIYIFPALLLPLLDTLSAPLEIAPMTGERPLIMLRSSLGTVVKVDGTLMAAAIPLTALVVSSPNMLPFALVPFVIFFYFFRGAFQMRDATRLLLESMADAVDLRDPYTGGHSRRVADYTARILQHMSLSGPETDLIITAARVHDIGKIGVADAILNKPGRLTDAERTAMEQHPVLGARLLARYPDFARGCAIVRHHHERLDGAGYPDGLRGDAIPFGARVIAVADTYDALTSDRPYRSGMDHARATQILRDGAGTQWEPTIVGALLSALEPATQITDQLPIAAPSQTAQQSA